MFYCLCGELVHTDNEIAVIMCGGVGYKCFVTQNTRRMLPAEGDRVTLFTHLNVREDSVELFGFIDEEELNCFKLLTSVSGVGVRVGIGMLSELSAAQIAVAIASDDARTLTRAPGVGNKLASRIILELQDKMGRNMPNVRSSTVAASAANNAAEAINALSVLGYNQADIAPVVASFDSSLPVEELIRLSLKAMARRK